MKVRIRSARLIVNDKPCIAVAVFYGEHWYRPISWRRYELFGRLATGRGFHIGPILFWDGN